MHDMISLRHGTGLHKAILFEVYRQMIQTLDFIGQVWKNENLRDRLLENLADQKETNVVIGVHSLVFDFERRTVTITCGDPDYFFKSKMVPIEMTFHSLELFIHHQLEFEYKII